MMTKDFHLGDILSITTGCLVSPTHMDGVYKILNWMTSDNLYTHQLIRASKECQPELLRQHPQLAGITLPTNPPLESTQEAINAWVQELALEYGEMLPVTKLAGDDHVYINPLEELAAMVGPEKVIVVKL